MVRLKREMQGLDWGGGAGDLPHRTLAALRTIADGPIEQLAIGLEGIEGGKVLAVGISEAGLRSLIANRPRQLTAVEPDQERRARLLDAVQAVGATQFCTVQGKDYASVGFERSSFDVAILVDCLEHYESPTNVLRKCAREVKMGGTMGFRYSRPIRLDDSAQHLRRLITPRGLATALKELHRVTLARNGAEVRESTDLTDLEEAVSDLVRVRSRVPVWAYVPALFDWCASRAPALVPLVVAAIPLLRVADRELLAQQVGVWWVESVKDVQFGRIFEPETLRDKDQK